MEGILDYRATVCGWVSRLFTHNRQCHSGGTAFCSLHANLFRKTNGNLIHCEALALKGDFIIKKEDQVEDKSPFSREAHAKALEFLRSMTPEELMDFMEYRAPGMEETDMTGHFPINPPRPILTSAKERQKKTA